MAVDESSALDTPETFAQHWDKKYPIPCHKEPGCVEYRVKWLQHRRIVIDPARTPNAHREFVSYSYETDKDGNILARLPDKDNHTIDTAAYALAQLIYRRGVSA